ncbi:MAG: BrnT family toxin [bacterium]
MALTFEWDEEKSRRNFRKHGVSFEEARTVFNDPFAITINDPDHSDAEERYIDIGFSSKGRLVVVWYTERNENIRIIGCRKATNTERISYESKES